MLIVGNSKEKNFRYLSENLKKLINQGVCLDKILVLALNSYKKACLINKLKEENISGIEVTTPYGLCYNAFLKNKEYISGLSGQNSNKDLNLCGLEVSQYIFKQCIKDGNFKDYISKVNLLHQLFRRYSLMVQNELTAKEVIERSEILGESFAIEAQKAINEYKLKTIEYNSYDYLRQLALFPKLYKQTDYFSNVEYLFVFDSDELSYTIWNFIKFLVPNLKNYFIFADENGSTRAGYLCAYKSGLFNFIHQFSPEIIRLSDNSKYSDTAELLFYNIKNQKKSKLKDINVIHKIKRLDMLDEVINKIQELILKGVKCSDISIITPLIDEVLINTFNEVSEINFQFLSGNEKLADVKAIKFILILLKSVNNIPLREFEVKSILADLLNIPLKKCFGLIIQYNNSKSFPMFNFANQNYDFNYKKLLSVINSLSKVNSSLEEQIKAIYENLVKEKYNDKEKYEFLLKEAGSFTLAFGAESQKIINDFIIQTENSVISENPVNSFKLATDKIIVSSAQKITDYSLNTKYQLWLDISSSAWQKQDNGTLYNAWVLSRDWNKNSYGIEDNICLTADKTARIVRKLMLLAEKEIMFFSSLYDNAGNENYLGISNYIDTEEKEVKPAFNIIPRPDQKPVLEYKQGKMGIMAVPGAGKTTILLALIIKLINNGISPENIFVLTYMESAAKNFKERLKSAIPGSVELPNISTIHGLALRIIKENGNYIKAGLDEDFEICDDSNKDKIIRELFYILKIDNDKYENYIKCLSLVKLSINNNELTSKYKEIQEFFNFYNEYNKKLKENNLIDYDDMLYFAVKILKENEEILKYYQEICKYVIEDEAQDSSEIQQLLIELISGKYNNIVRCGDVNQAITSTFTSSDLKGFKNFLLNKKIEMNVSQRCASQIYSLANRIIDYSFKSEETKNAFYKIKIEGTDKNPKSDSNPEYFVYQDEEEEKSDILNKIIEIKNKTPNASIAVLLRLNSQVSEYNEYFLRHGINTSIRSDILCEKNIFKLIYSVLNILKNPLNNDNICNLAKIYNENRIIKLKENEFDYIKTLKEPFVNMSPDNIESESLLQLFWDVDYWLNQNQTSIDLTALKIGLFYSKTSVEKSNTYIISTIIKKLMNNSDDEESIIKNLEFTAKRPSGANKFFDDENSDMYSSCVEIMTMHKSKGDEFDYVFIPKLNEDNYPLNIKNVKLKSGSHFISSVKNALDNSGLKNVEQLKKEQIEENLRLLYVGFTRAKLQLFLSSASKTAKGKKISVSEFVSALCQKTVDLID